MPVPQLPIFIGRARKRRRDKSTILPIDATDKQIRRAQRRHNKGGKVQ